MATASNQVAELVYDAAARELLTGTIGTAPRFHLVAYSGGNRGHVAKSSSKRADNSSSKSRAPYLYKQAHTLLSHLATTQTKEHNGVYSQRGGTIPPGHDDCVYVKHHPTFGECIRLLRHKDAEAIHSPFSAYPIPHGRANDFFIHGSGAKGSDGCIVPALRGERLRLNKAVHDFQGTVVLYVTNVSYMLPAEVGYQLA
jgi:hypothetical protein